MSFQSCKNPNFGNFGTPNLGVLGQNDIWVQPWWLGIENTIRGEGDCFPQVQAMVSLVNPCMPMACLCIKNVPTEH